MNSKQNAKSSLETKGEEYYFPLNNLASFRWGFSIHILILMLRKLTTYLKLHPMIAFKFKTWLLCKVDESRGWKQEVKAGNIYLHESGTQIQNAIQNQGRVQGYSKADSNISNQTGQKHKDRQRIQKPE